MDIFRAGFLNNNLMDIILAVIITTVYEMCYINKLALSIMKQGDLKVL